LSVAEFHFLRPLWLLALPIGLLLIWRLFGGKRVQGSWRAVVDVSLQPFVLALPEKLSERRLPLLLAAAVWIAGSLALAGPTYQRLPVPAFRSGEALVVALDLSRSMDAGDVVPSRLARAKLKLLSLLERRASGQTALVVFSANAFTVSPLTTDTRTIGSLINALFTDIMPSQGSYPEAGMQRAGNLLRQTGLNEGTILLMTDSDVSPGSLEVARDLRRGGFTVSVLAVGTQDGAPIPNPEGGFLSDSRGQVVVPRLDTAGLAELAAAGRGRYAQLTADDSDLGYLFPDRSVADLAELVAEDDAGGYEADIWRDEGVWLALLLLPFLALGFRRGWVAVCLIWLAVPVPQAQAFEWRDLWVKRDRQGFEALQSEQAERAAQLFEDPDWRAAAQYRAGDYSGSVATLGRLDSALAHYNRGNALARSGQLEPAIQAYDAALALDPGNQDAVYNRDLVQDLLDQQEQEQQQQEQQDQQDSGEQGEQGENEEQSGSGESEGEEGDSESGDSASQSADSEGQNPGDASPEGSDDQGSDSPEPLQADAGDEQQQPGEGEPDDPQAGEVPQGLGPEELEQWASEQAADQWLRRIPQDPGGLLRRKFLYQYQRLGVDQDGNFVWPGDEAQPW
jgi:Ca-activated chloride channel family protein